MRRCSSTTTQTIGVAVVTSPTLTVRWCSISSMFLSVRYSLRSVTTFGIRLIFSMRKNSMRSLDCITYGARYYDPRLSLCTSVDPLSGIAPNYSGYRYCFDNPTKFVDLLGLFETRSQAKEYRAMNGIKGRIQKNEDGTYSINDYKNHISYAQGDDSRNMLGDQHKHDGVIESVLVTNKKNRFGLGDLYDSGDFGLNLFTEYGYDRIPTSKKSKIVYETGRA